MLLEKKYLHNVRYYKPKKNYYFKNNEMIRKFIFLSVSISCIIACGAVVTESKNKIDSEVIDRSHKVTDTTATIVENCDVTNIAKVDYVFENDEFISNALKRPLTCFYTDSIFNDVKKQIKISKNKYSDTAFDTTVTYKAACDSVSYISSNANCFLLYLSIQSTRISFDNGCIKVGLTKADFAKRFKLNNKIPNIIKITEQEEANEVIFIFKGDKLSRIVYRNLYVE